MRNRHRARLFGVVDEVSLTVVGGVFADDLDGVLVCAHGAIRAEAVEHGSHDVVGLDGKLGIVVETGVAYVVLNADRKVVFGSWLFQVVVNGLDHGGRKFLGRQAVTPADDFGRDFQLPVAQFDSLVDAVDDVEIERLSASSGFLGAVENSDLLNGCRKSFDEAPHGERAVQPDFQQPNLFALLVEIVGGFVRGLRAGTHHDDYAIGVGRAHVVEQVIRTADDLGKLVHDRLNFVGANVVVGIASFTRLKIDIGILCRAA